MCPILFSLGPTLVFKMQFSDMKFFYFQISRFMVLVPRACSLSRLPKMNPRSPLSTTLAPQPSALSAAAAAPSSVAVASVAVWPSVVVVVVVASSVQALAVVKMTAITTTGVAVAIAAVVSVGRTMTSRSALVSRRSTFAPSGRCWRRLTSTVSPS